MKLLILMLLCVDARAEDLLEFRLASHAEYRYADWSHSFQNKLATDVYYIGVPGNNELSACLGYSLPSKHGLSLTPFFCGTTAKENGEFGLKAALLATWEKGKWKADAYYARFQPLSGKTNSYDVLDAGNLTYALKNWELGISTGFFRQASAWNPLAGPLVRRNDPLGFWFMSLRFGPQREIRFGRVLTLGRPRK